MEVKKCPFCGCETVNVRGNITRTGTFYWTECILCKARTRSLHESSQLNELPDELIERSMSLWNIRTGGDDNGRTENVRKDDSIERFIS